MQEEVFTLSMLMISNVIKQVSQLAFIDAMLVQVEALMAGGMAVTRALEAPCQGSRPRLCEELDMFLRSSLGKSNFSHGFH